MDSTRHLSKVQNVFVKQMNKQSTTWSHSSQRCNCLSLFVSESIHTPARPCSTSYSLYLSIYKSGPFLQPHRGQLAGGPLHFEEIDVVTALSVILEALLVLWGEGGRTQLKG